MAKQRSEAAQAMRRVAWEQKVAAMRDGRVQKAATHKDRRKDASRKACRGKVAYQ
jgi:hypothetical protein